jgi:predicted RNA methylase
MTIAKKQIWLSDDALAVLSSGTVVDNIFLINAGQLDRKLYQDVNGVLERLGGKWSRKARGHIFSFDPTERIETVLLTGSVEDTSHLGFFATPAPLAKRLVELAHIDPDHICLEPSAGTGSIVSELVAIVGQEGVVAVEIDDQRAAVLTASFPGVTVHQRDFMDIPAAEAADRVVMNPPFAQRQDIAHVRHAFRFLRPGGRLVAIMAAGITFRQDAKSVAFRSLIEHANGQIIPNPEDAFRESGTQVNTVTVVMNRR